MKLENCEPLQENTSAKERAHKGREDTKETTRRDGKKKETVQGAAGRQEDTTKEDAHICREKER